MFLHSSVTIIGLFRIIQYHWLNTLNNYILSSLGLLPKTSLAANVTQNGTALWIVMTVGGRIATPTPNTSICRKVKKIENTP